MLNEPQFVAPLVEMYQAGANQKEIVETLGISYCQCRYWLKKKDLFDSSRRQHNLLPAQEYNRELWTQAKENLIDKLRESGFDYLGGYENRKSKVYIQCYSCGAIFRRVPQYWSFECPECNDSALKRYERKQIQRRYERVKKIVRSRKEARSWQRQQDQEYHRLYDARICAWCNKIFTIREYEEKEGKSNVQCLSHCSKECRRSHERHNLKNSKTDRHHRERALRNGVDYVPGITLRKLVQKNGLTCALCGGKCNWKDKRYGDCGPKYPSIDHIIPLSKGGAHTWENVQVAHFECNSNKRDYIGEEWHNGTEKTA